MVAAQTVSPETANIAATLVVQRQDGWRCMHTLSAEQGVLVGTSDNCGLRLEGDSVSAFHCFFSLEDGKLWVQDWLSAGGTLVNDERISQKVTVHADDTIGVGEYRISSELGTASTWRQDHQTGPTAEPRRVLDAPSDDSATDGSEEPRRSSVAHMAQEPGTNPMHDDAHLPVEQLDAPAEFVSASDSLADTRESHEPSPVDDAEAVNLDALSDGSLPVDDAQELDSGRFEQEDAIDELAGAGFDAFDTGLFEGDGFDSETIQLLRLEIEELQGTLAQRDAQLAELTTQRDQGAGHPEPMQGEGEHSESLVARLEELLEEAECSDERVAVLEETLRTAEEANEAEREERQQLEAWLGDVERRIGQREAEWKAEIESLQKRLETTVEERDRTEHRLRQAASQGNAPAQFEETLERLREQNKDLHEKLTTLETQRSGLAHRLERIQDGHDEAVREERAAMAQERAKLSRLRAELSSKMSSLEEQPRSREPGRGEVVERLQALRDHLRELHDDAEQEATETTLMSRVSRLWKRLER